MTFPRVRVSYILPFALVACVAIVPVGCGSEAGVTKYEVPKDANAGNDNVTEKYRMLGAMFPADNPKWFFKFSGPTAEIAKYEAGFDELLKSVKLNEDKPLEFTPPKDWERGPGRGSFVTATVKTPDGKLEVTLTQSGGGVEMNLSRWVGQIGLKAKAADMAKFTKDIETTSGVKGLRVDLKGPNDPATKSGPMMPQGHP